MLTHECKGNASYKHLSIKQENIDLYYKKKPRIFATVPELHPFYGKPAHNRKPILQYTKGGEFVKEWLGAFEIEKELGIAGTKIAAVCKGKRKSAGGYKWKYKNE